MSIIPSNSKVFYIVLNQHRHLSNTAVKDTSWYKVVLILRIIDIVGHSGHNQLMLSKKDFWDYVKN